MESRKGQPLKILYSDFYSETVLDIVQDNNDAQFYILLYFSTFSNMHILNTPVVRQTRFSVTERNKVKLSSTLLLCC